MSSLLDASSTSLQAEVTLGGDVVHLKLIPEVEVQPSGLRYINKQQRASTNRNFN